MNGLDKACMKHDIFYSSNKDSSERGKADSNLIEEALNRFKSSDSSWGEKLSSLAVAGAIKVKKTLSGGGLESESQSSSRKMCKKTLAFDNLVKNARAAIKKSKTKNIDNAVKIAVQSAKKARKGRSVKKPRVIKLPKRIIGGIIPIIPILAGLAAAGGIGSNIANIIRTAREIRNADKHFHESKTPNKMLETKIGNGLYLNINKKTGSGLYLFPNSKNY